MNFIRIFGFVFVFVMALNVAVSAPNPRWNPFKKLERLGQNIRDGIIKAGPAVSVIGQAATIVKTGK
ncbi:unnamed protein product [Parnassius apollo]|uniref:(apollo) hypothetical protein n=1 Tax=Parnassius apollo TaxID=110799 RepID=A0A8S3WL69_PARAO|nr:unnamed protein product [Parnassius apollo]